ncbi:hypothetical protein [Streptomyces lancefieldiae]|uniref:Uncharacterized protein n=1 Tax=Streptomyces lancefieldiae TaxID=3075520 RepID=A0ABU3AI78_9ACTN|nr:hypothetical protein [Streptomyces sp. DSM 40712]MDT0608773.1 hypothetical protein [Streptomyces sp. DSM 40712]
MISPQSETRKVSLAAELRNAAAKLRKHVKHATDGPWVTSSVWSPRATSTSAVYSHAHPTGTVESEVVASGKIRSGYGGIREPWNAEYIALMQPAVGAALADWLEQAAENYETEVDTPECPSCGEGCGGHAAEDFCTTCGDEAPCLCIVKALTVARLINGEEVAR